jgi:hypothetical protein
LENLLAQQVASLLHIAPAEIDRREPLRIMGLTSMMALELTNYLAVTLK